MSLTITGPTTPEQFLHGVNARLLFAATAGATAVVAFPVEQIDFEHDGDLDDVSHSEAQGWDVLLEGRQRANVNITFIFDLANSPNVSPRSLQALKTAYLHCVLDAQASPGLPTVSSTQDYNGTFKVKNVKFPTGPKAGPVRVVASLKSTGPVNLPSV